LTNSSTVITAADPQLSRNDVQGLAVAIGTAQSVAIAIGAARFGGTPAASNRC
jgi:hypothetical protein